MLCNGFFSGRSQGELERGIHSAATVVNICRSASCPQLAATLPANAPRFEDTPRSVKVAHYRGMNAMVAKNLPVTRAKALLRLDANAFFRALWYRALNCNHNPNLRLRLRLRLGLGPKKLHEHFMQH